MSKWPMVSLSTVLKPVSRPETVDDLKTYRILGAHWYAHGLYVKDTLSGAEIRASKVYRVKAGDFVYNRLFAWKGSFAVVDIAVNDCVVSNEFPCFEIDKTQIAPGFLWHYFRLESTWNNALGLSSGGTPTSRNRLKENLFLQMEIPLPPLSEQLKIVEWIDAVATRVAEAKSLRGVVEKGASDELFHALQKRVFEGKVVRQHKDDGTGQELAGQIAKFRSTIDIDHKLKSLPPIEDNELLHEIPPSWTWIRLGDLCSVITDGTHQTPTYVEDGRPFLSAQNVKPFRFMPEIHKKVSAEDFELYRQRVTAERGDILMTRVGAMIGEAALIDQDIEFAYYVSLCLIKPIRSYIHIPYILHWLNSPYGAHASRTNTLGKGHSQGNLNLNFIRQFVLPLPPLPEQERIVNYLGSMRTLAVERAEAASSVSDELESLLPSLLNQIFNGGDND